MLNQAFRSPFLLKLQENRQFDTFRVFTLSKLRALPISQSVSQPFQDGSLR
jgi:hypothetical protein